METIDIKEELRKAQNFEILKGFVTLHKGLNEGQIVARGLFLPHIDPSGQLRSKAFGIERRSPAWFLDLARELVKKNKEGMEVEMQVTNNPAMSICFVSPVATSRKEAEQAWELEHIDRLALPTTLSLCNDSAEQIDLVYRAVAKFRNIKLIRVNREDDVAFGVSVSGQIYRMRGADQFRRRLEFRDRDLFQEVQELRDVEFVKQTDRFSI